MFTNKSLEFIMSQTVRAADLACCAKGQALQFSFDFSPLYWETPGCFTGRNRTMCRLRILHIQNLTCIAPFNIFSKCVFYITVLPRRSALIITSLKQTTCTHWKKNNQPKPLKQAAQHSGAALLQHSSVYKESKKKIQLGMEVNVLLHNCK